MALLTRKIVIPVVLGVWAVAGLVSIHTAAVLPWFTHYYDSYVGESGFKHALIATAYRHCYPFGAMLLLGTLISGIGFLRQRETDTARFVWFVVLTIVVAAAWFVWTLLAEQSIYVLSLPA